MMRIMIIKKEGPEIMTLIDTSVLSSILRRNKSDEHTKKFVSLLMENKAFIIGPIRQKLLSGISNESQFHLLKDKLKAIPEISITSEDYKRAASFFNICRKNGVQGSHIDFLICAVAYRNNMQIYTLDQDFISFNKYLDIQLRK